MSRKASNEMIGIKQPGGVISWVSDDDREKALKIPNGTAVRVTKLRDQRNIKFHRKFFALLNLAFEYWEPAWKMTSDAERWIAHKVAKVVAEKANDPKLYDSVTKHIADEVLSGLASKRTLVFDPEMAKTADTFRAEMLIKAGCYDLVNLPGGGAYRKPWSISFQNMSEDVFSSIYPKVFSACWHSVLFQKFENEKELESLINQMSGFLS